LRLEHDIREMLIEAKCIRNIWLEAIMNKDWDNKQEMLEAVRNYNALRGVVKSLQWILSDAMPSPLS
jgi:hypothetical protein